MTVASLLSPRALLILVLTAAAVAVVRPPDAAAQSVEAEALFQQGKKLMAAGNVAEACDKFEASDRLEASVGTELNLADCREKNGQLASAWAAFLKAAGTAKRAGNDGAREAEAKRRATALTSRLSYLTISVADSSKVDGLVIQRNGEPVDPALWNTGVPVDPGVYEISGQAPGMEAWSTKVTVEGEGQKASVEVPRFKRLEDLAPKDVHGAADGTGGGTGDGAVALPPPADHVDRPGTFTTLRKASIGAAAIGLAALGGGVVFGLKAKDQQDQADALCPNEACNNPEAIALNDDAHGSALKANIMMGVGGVAVAGAVALWFLGAPPAVTADDDGDVAVAPMVGGGHVGLALSGRF